MRQERQGPRRGLIQTAVINWPRRRSLAEIRLGVGLPAHLVPYPNDANATLIPPQRATPDRFFIRIPL